MKRWLTIVLLVMVVPLILISCNDQEIKDSKNDSEESVEVTTDKAGESDESLEDRDSTKDEVSVTLQDRNGNRVAEATLTSVHNGVKVQLNGEGSTAGEHGFHVHEKGLCEPKENFKSAGGHYNPTDKNHGKKNPNGPHAGDFDNLIANEEGKFHAEFVTDQISLVAEAENTVFTEHGTSLVIHANPDDYQSQPAGNAGERIACGVIAEPK